MGIIVADVGATKTRAAWYESGDLDVLKSTYVSHLTERDRPQGEILQTIYKTIDEVAYGRKPEAISIVIPGTFDEETGKIISCGIVHNLNDCPVQEKIEERYHVPCIVNNDGNAFAIAEYTYGKRNTKGMVGIVLGTGFGSGHVINGQLYVGKDGSAGEYGRLMHPFGGIVDDMCSGRWFELEYNVKGEEMFKRVQEGDAKAIEAFEKFGKNIAHGLLKPIYAYGPWEIVIGGAGKDTYPYFAPSMFAELNEVQRKPGKHFSMPIIRPGVLDHPNLAGAGIIYEQAKSQLKKRVIA
jgi:glucokinase